MTITFDFATAPGHQILAAAGKKILRPGGKAATEQLLTWADFQPGETVLELAASFGESAIEIARRFNVFVVGIEKNPDSVAKARKNIKAAGLEDRVTIIEGDIFQLDKITVIYLRNKIKPICFRCEYDMLITKSPFLIFGNFYNSW